MVDMLDIKTLVDIGFVMLVVAICARSVRGGENAGQQLTQAWKGELDTLAESLRELVDEAAASSRNLDRRLMQRKRELELLLGEIDSKTSSINNSQEKEAEDDFPNETWKVAAKERPRSKLTKAQRQARYEEHLAKIEQAMASKRSKEAANQSRGGDLKKSLVEQIEATKEKQENEFLNNPTSITDPVALSIAKRLLLSGKSAQVIAKKLDVPVVEIQEFAAYLQAEGELRPKKAVQAESTASSYTRAGSSPRGKETIELEEVFDEDSSLETLIDQIEDRSFI